jgi:hypothetical protein
MPFSFLKGIFICKNILGLCAENHCLTFVRSPSLYRAFVYAYAPICTCIHKSTSLSPPQLFSSKSFFSFYYAIDCATWGLCGIKRNRRKPAHKTFTSNLHQAFLTMVLMLLMLEKFKFSIPYLCTFYISHELSQ